MPRYQDESIQFDLPRDWQDRTIVAFAAPARPGQERTANVVMTREELATSETLSAYVDRHVEQLTERLEGFELVERESRPLAGRSAVLLRIRSGSAPEKFEQRLTLLELPRRVVATITLTTPAEDAAQMGPLFDRILSTLRIGTQKQDAGP